MSNHPNRSQRRPRRLARSSERRNPYPADIKRAREKAGLTQTQAAEIVHSKVRVWQQWEADEGTSTHRRMHPAFWELFLIKTKDQQGKES